jgi:aspartate-semialdehyde dehydrogenase
MKKLNVAVVGATGLVGREFIKVLEQQRFPVSSVRLLDTEHALGSELFFDHRSITVEEILPEAFLDTDIVMFFAGADISRRIVPVAVRTGAVVIDNSTAFSGEEEVPLVVPEINPEDIKLHKGIISNPNCTALQLSVILYPLHQVNPVKRVIISTYQSVSSSGAAALKELTNQIKLVLDGYRVCPHIYAHQIAFNVLPEIGLFLDNGYTKEEQRIAEETRKVMHADNISISATCVRVPVYYGDSAAVHIEFDSPMNPDKVRKILAEAPGVRIIDDCSVSLYPQPWAVSGSSRVFVGRIRRDISKSNGVALWIVADNIYRGAALNALHILEEGTHRGWIKSKKIQEE